jgi:hypothetical protein
MISGREATRNPKTGTNPIPDVRRWGTRKRPPIPGIQDLSERNEACYSQAMGAKRLQTIERRIQRIKDDLATIGEMRPGSLSKQYNVCGTPGCRCKDPENPQKHGPYYQLSYVHRNKSTSQFIRPEFATEARAQTKEYRRFRKLVDEWVRLALEHARMKLEMAKKEVSR